MTSADYLRLIALAMAVTGCDVSERVLDIMALPAAEQARAYRALLAELRGKVGERVGT